MVIEKDSVTNEDLSKFEFLLKLIWVHVDDDDIRIGLLPKRKIVDFNRVAKAFFLSL